MPEATQLHQNSKNRQSPASRKQSGCSGKILKWGIFLGLPALLLGSMLYNVLPAALIRSNTIDIHHDFRQIHYALEDYYDDHQTYPMAEADGHFPSVLTTPVAYYTIRSGTLFQDIFKSRENPFYSYFYDPGHNIYVIHSNGPDRDRDLTDYSVLINENIQNQEKITSIDNKYRYDPTNGYYTNGDKFYINIENRYYR